jgi:hypothetical protein
MIIKDQLLAEHSKKNTQLICSFIGTDVDKMKELMDCFFSNEYRISQRAAMAVSECFDQHPHLLLPYLAEMCAILDREDVHIALTRNTVRIFQFVQLPAKLQAKVFDQCLGFLQSPQYPVAVKAFSMTVLYNICKEFPELKAEVIPVLEQEMAYAEKPGILSRGRKIMKQLHQLP